MVKMFANSEDPDQTPRSALSDLDLHSLPVNYLGVSSVQWDKAKYLVGFNKLLCNFRMGIVNPSYFTSNWTVAVILVGETSN